MRDFKESDWKIFRALHEVALDRFCQRVLATSSEIISDAELGNHERYLKLYKLVRERDKELAHMFDRVSRSAALEQLTLLRRENLVTDDEFARFSSETRDAINSWLSH